MVVRLSKVRVRSRFAARILKYDEERKRDELGAYPLPLGICVEGDSGITREELELWKSSNPALVEGDDYVVDESHCVKCGESYFELNEVYSIADLMELDAENIRMELGYVDRDVLEAENFYTLDYVSSEALRGD